MFWGTWGLGVNWKSGADSGPHPWQLLQPLLELRPEELNVNGNFRVDTLAEKGRVEGSELYSLEY